MRVTDAASFDRRPTLTRREAREVYDGFATKGHIGGKDASSGYGGPAVQALLTMAAFADPRVKTVIDYGCGQGKLAEVALEAHPQLEWRGIDQSPEMVLRAQERLHRFGDRSKVELLSRGDPAEVGVGSSKRVDRFVSTYCLDLLSEADMFGVLDAAQRSLRPNGLLLLSGITYGYRRSWKTCLMTLIWSLLYRFTRKTVGGCRPQVLEPYLKARGWTVVSRTVTLPTGFPWMASEVIAAAPPP